MSGESLQHIRIVEQLIAEISSRHVNIRRVIFADHRSYGENQPPTIGGFKPDVLVQDVPMTFRAIGEAKTDKDLDEDRSQRQIAAFLDHLSLYANSSFYLGVPWYLKGRANFLLKTLRKPEYHSVNISVLAFT